jgi:formylglycine-generating enzyme required for sulfatase activity
MSVFISYSRSDGTEAAEVLAQKLRSREIEAFLDRESIRAGALWQQVIRDKLKKSRIFIILLTPGAVESDWVYKEFQLAMEGKKTILPVRIGDVKVPPFLRGTWQDTKVRDAQDLDKVVTEVLHTLLSTSNRDVHFGKFKIVAATLTLIASSLGYLANQSEFFSTIFPKKQEKKFPTEQSSFTPSAHPSSPFKFGDSFKDTLSFNNLSLPGPEMIVIPGGSFDFGGLDFDADKDDNESPRKIGVSVQTIAVAKTEVSREEFKIFVESTTPNFITSAEKDEGAPGESELGCYAYTRNDWKYVDSFDWKNPGFEQPEKHPVVCVSRKDAIAYTEWLSKVTRHSYRLPTEQEQEYFMRADSHDTIFPWGNELIDGCKYFNGQRVCEDDPSERTMAVNSDLTSPNKYGLMHTIGNVAEISESPFLGPPSAKQVSSEDVTNTGYMIKGGCYLDTLKGLRPSFRTWRVNWYRDVCIGFRVVRDLQPQELE